MHPVYRVHLLNDLHCLRKKGDKIKLFFENLSLYRYIFSTVDLADKSKIFFCHA